jgi:integrase
MFRWVVKKGYLTRNPAADSDALRREQMARRDRRLEPGEEERLLEHAGAHLQRLMIAALESGCRRGELLGLQWRDVRLDRREMTIRAEKSRTRIGRVIPVSARLIAVLEMAHAGLVAALPKFQSDDAGAKHVADCYVFGDGIGRQVTDIKKAWETAVVKAHGHKPAWTRGNALSAASREAFRAANLTFHDLRHEAGSWLLEAGWPLHNVAHMLGHANISQTSTYLNATKVGLQDSMRRLDASRGEREAHGETATGSSGRAQETLGEQPITIN